MTTGVDVGGTFTDVVRWDGIRLVTGKVPTTSDQADGVMEALAAVDGERSPLLHGTTAATNAVLQRSGARTALVTDAGFEDVIEIGRQDRPSLYDASVTRPAPLIESRLRFGVPGRSTADRPADLPEVEEVAEAIAAADVEAVAVSLLYSFLDAEREEAIAEGIRRRSPGVRVALSAEVAPEIREFERTSTTVLNAYLLPVVADYLGRLARQVPGEPSIMRSSGGLMALEEASRFPAAILLSGPAGGAVAAAALGNALGYRRIISFDMGGTSTDVCRIEGGAPMVTYRRAIDGLPCSMPSVAIHTVGAGGGSVGWVDPGGALRVGPRSAGARPGPASYGLGGDEATVTDADLVLGRVGSQTPLGGGLRLDRDAALRTLGALGVRIGDASPVEVAAGMVEVVEAHMERAVRQVSIDEGADPREAVLVAFGGAGGLHATALARRLDMAGVVIPPHGGVFSALGLLLAPPRVDVAHSVILDGLADLEVTVAGVADEAARRAPPGATVESALDLRYRGQSHETTVTHHRGETEEALLARFHEAHRMRNGFSREGDPVEVVTVRASAVGVAAMRWDDLPAPKPEGEVSRGHREVHHADGTVECDVVWRPALAEGDRVEGPAVIEENEATTYLGIGERATVLLSGALEVEW